MKIVTLPDTCPEHYYYKEYTTEEKKAYRGWLSMAKEMVGLSQDIPLSLGIGRYPPYRYLWYDNVLYESKAGTKTFKRVWSGNQDNNIEAVCECGGISFNVITSKFQGTNLKCLECGERIIV